MNDSAMRLMVLAHRERLISRMGRTRVRPEEAVEPAMIDSDRQAMREERPALRWVVSLAVAILSSVIAFAFIHDERMSQIAAPHASGIGLTEGAQTATAPQQDLPNGRPVTTPVVRVKGSASDAQQAKSSMR